MADTRLGQFPSVLPSVGIKDRLRRSTRDHKPRFCPVTHHMHQEEGNRRNRLIQSSPSILTRISTSEEDPESYFISLNDIKGEEWDEKCHVRMIGGKAIHLAELSLPSATSNAQNSVYWGKNTSLPSIKVPEAGCCTTKAYDAYITKLGLQGKLKQVLEDYEGQVDKKEIEKQLSFIRKCIMQERKAKEGSQDPLPIPLQEKVHSFINSLPHHIKRVAVRSSSTLEDQEGSSFAGQYDTFLNVPKEFSAISLAVRKCWASMWQIRLLSYRKHHGMLPSDLPDMAVVIQRQLFPKASGVLFTLDPIHGCTDHMVIESCYGLGEGVVCGEISPHTFVMNWNSFETVSSDCTPQNLKFSCRDTLNDHGEYIELVETSQFEQQNSSLNASQRIQLVQLGLQIATFYQHPQDIEWALLESGEIFILQARPITAFTVQLPLQWTYAAFGDQGLLSLSMASSSYSSMMHTFLQDGKPDYKNKFNETALSLSCFSHGFILSKLWNDYNTNLPHIWKEREAREQHEFLAKKIAFHRNEFLFRISPKHISVEQKIGELDLENIISLIRELLVFQKGSDQISFLVGDTADYFEFKVSTYVNYLNQQVELCSPFTLVPLLDGVHCDSEVKQSSFLLRLLATAGASISSLTSMIREYILLDAQEDLYTAEFRKNLENDANPNCNLFICAFQTFTERFYYMSASSDEDVGSMRYKQDPSVPWTILINLLIGKLGEDHSSSVTDNIEEAYSAIREKPKEVISQETDVFVESLASLCGHLDAVNLSDHADYIRDLVSSLRMFIHFKEEIHIMYTKNLYFLRHCLSEYAIRLSVGYNNPKFKKYWVGDQNSSHGAISPDHPLFFLSTDQLVCLLDLTSKDQNIDQILSHASIQHYMFAKFQIPPIIGANKKLHTNNIVLPSFSTEMNMNGLPCAAGEATGRCCIIDSLQDSGKVKAGDVLVTRYTDPSWTPLFSLISGIIIEEGGVLSHAAVVARECGIPAITKVTNARKSLPAGKLLYMNGSEGTISVLDEQ